MKTDYFYCVKTFESKNFGNFKKHKNYQATFYSYYGYDCIDIIDENKDTIDFKIHSMLYQNLIPHHLIPIKER